MQNREREGGEKEGGGEACFDFGTGREDLGEVVVTLVPDFQWVEVDFEFFTLMEAVYPSFSHFILLRFEAF